MITFVQAVHTVLSNSINANKDCGGMNENALHRFIGSGVIGRWDLDGGRVSLGMGFEVSDS